MSAVRKRKQKPIDDLAAPHGITRQRQPALPALSGARISFVQSAWARLGDLRRALPNARMRLQKSCTLHEPVSLQQRFRNVFARE